MSTEAPQTGHLILVVDDDQDYLYQTKIELEALGYRTVTAFSAAEAVETAAAHKPDLVVADLMMEADDAGFALCYQLKKEYPDLPVIMVTGVASETGLPFDAATPSERAWLKADVLLDKPVRYEQLQREIARLLSK